MKPIYKISIVVGIIIVGFIVAYSIWNSLTGESSNEPEVPAITPLFPTPPRLGEEGPQDNGNEDTLNASEKTLHASESEVFDFWNIPGTNETYYITPEGKVFGLKEGPDLEISSQSVEALNNIEVSPNGQKALASFGDPQAPQWGIFDVIDKVWRPLPGTFITAAWNSSNSELLALTEKGSDFSLIKLDVSKSPPTEKVLIKDFRVLDINIFSLSSQEALLIERPSSQFSSKIWKLNTTTLALSLFLQGEEGRVVEWSDDAMTAFVFNKNNFRILDGKTLEIKSPFPLYTLPQKCSSSSSVAFCFIPKEQIEQTEFPDEYYQNKFFTIDDLAVINLDSGEFFTMTLDGAYDAIKPTLVGEKLFFINRYDNTVYSLPLVIGD